MKLKLKRLWSKLNEKKKIKLNSYKSHLISSTVGWMEGNCKRLTKMKEKTTIKQKENKSLSNDFGVEKKHI